MADERKVEVIDYEALWKALRSTLTELIGVYGECASDDFLVGKLAAYRKVFSLMRDFEGVYEEAE